MLASQQQSRSSDLAVAGRLRDGAFLFTNDRSTCSTDAGKIISIIVSTQPVSNVQEFERIIDGVPYKDEAVYIVRDRIILDPPVRIISTYNSTLRTVRL